ncbi:MULTISPECIES: MaoC/PaaZ C-terminal domain-containing protein [unclassified Sphingopyxis]|uniref:MaoC/PaaZ C-terminal domain-containing protein n=1 Tax=unclassified Sphingopyxis TaxID=2614943 RepID=UPI002866F7EC|nr:MULTISPECIES: MaoC/PaaZ C-terminal domain-containing protein [unclassified Sphingopyxis]MDR6834090.1 acyl dehydratase [Sphingopyxis sp. BE122]MDR7226358.1 acyl dehydratase [Sphingopyxis sp. BE259]
MAFQPDRLLAHDFGEARQSYTARDAILYALGLGLGHDPLDDSDLVFLDETRLKLLPSFAVTLCSPGMWIRDPAFGVDFRRLVHSAQAADYHAPLPAAADVVGTAKVVSLFDRGGGRGAVLELERRIADAASGEAYCTLRQTLLLRGNGGFGGPPPPASSSVIPDVEPSAHASVPLSTRAALIYRLSGDWNPLHIDPAFARSAGFDRPIMHGLGSYGVAGAAVARALGRDPATLSHLACRFSGIVLPGDTLQFTIWPTSDGAAFRAHVGDRLVLDEGQAAWRPCE